MYCSIQEAFETSSPAPAPSSKRSRGSKHRKPERPARTGETFTPDPDRPANVPMGSSDYVGGGIQQPSYSNILTAIDADSSYFPHPSDDNQDASAYMLEPDWTKQFDGPSLPPWIKERVAAKEAEIPLKPTPSWMDGQATLWQKIPGAFATPPPPVAAAPVYPDLDERFHQFESKLDSKLDAMFSKLADLEKGRSESSHIEIILFIIGGLFVLLMLDLLVKQGTRASLMLAAAGGASIGGGGSGPSAMDLYKRYMSW